MIMQFNKDCKHVDQWKALQTRGTVAQYVDLIPCDWLKYRLEQGGMALLYATTFTYILTYTLFHKKRTIYVYFFNGL